MITAHGYHGLTDLQQGAVIALGNFDGVHLGHRAVIDAARSLADRLSAPLGVALFDPHPRRYFAPDARTFRLMSAERRDRLLAGLGVDILHVLPFDADMAERTPAGFVSEVLADGLGVRGVSTGADFRFGAGRTGDTRDLERLCADLSIEVQLAALKDNGADKVSSTRIRKAIHDGNMPAAAALLGRPWVVDGIVQNGDQRGRTIGFPTANIDMGDYVRPAYGVYAVTVGLEGEPVHRPAVANIGKRPTVDGATELLEVHLLGFDGDLYGQPLAVEFREHLRAERKFDGLDGLKAQIAKDADAARSVLSAVSGPS